MTNMQHQRRNASLPSLDYVFHPTAIAVVGLSNDIDKAWLSECYITPMREMGFRGRLYVINPKGGLGFCPDFPKESGPRDLVAILHDWQELNLILFHNALGTPPLPPRYDNIAPAIEPMLSALTECRLPFALVWHSITNDDSWQTSRRLQEMCIKRGFPFFVSICGAALAMRRILELHSSRSSTVDSQQLNCH